ncbi:MAG: phosphotransferase family protein [Chloroflexi bacterium]|nr:phosphotransferase family protein [Chloroflexota bacterium]
MNRDAVEASFREHMPERKNLRVANLFRNVGGMSRQTYFADLEWEEGGQKRQQRYTVRMNHPGGLVVPVPLWWEYRCHKALYGTEIPVAQALWYEEDAPWEPGTSSYIREHIEGVSTPARLYSPEETALRAKIGYDFAEMLARVHMLDWKKAGFDQFMEVPKDDVDCAMHRQRHWKKNYEDNRLEPRPAVTELYAWLEENAPKKVERVSLVWGDVGVGNFIFHGDKIVALTDFEQSHLGDPLKDWASALWRGVGSLLPREELFRRYEEVSGIKVNEESVRYYTIFINTEYTTTCNFPLKNNYLPSKDKDATIASLTLSVPYVCPDRGLREMGY